MKRIVYLSLIVITLFACDDIVEGDNISAEAVTLLAPTNEAVLSIQTLTFTWESIEDAEKYHIQIATPTFSEALQIVKDSVTESVHYSTSLDPGSYEWRVRAENTGYHTTYTTQSFTIEE